MKTPFVTKAQIEEIVKTYPTPFHIYDEKGYREPQQHGQNAAFGQQVVVIFHRKSPSDLSVFHKQ